MSTSYNSVSVGTSATLIVPADGGRRGYGVINNSSSTIYIGPDASITASNGIPIASNSNFTDSGDGDNFKGNIYGITASGSADVRYWQWSG